jgi:AcrR family transcriptional regulator
MKRAQIGKPLKTGRPKWLAPLDDPRNETILAAAFDVFGEKGFHGATMLEIANRARVSKKTLYEHFAGKAGLFRALVAWGGRRNLPAAPPPPDSDPVAALEAHARAILTAMMRPESLALVRIVAAEAVRFPELGRDFDAQVRKASVAIVDALAARLGIADAAAFGADFIALLRGESYFRVLIGALPPPKRAALTRQAHHAVQCLLAAYCSSPAPSRSARPYGSSPW